MRVRPGLPAPMASRVPSVRVLAPLGTSGASTALAPLGTSGPRAIVTQNYVRPEIALEPHVSFRAIATFSPRPPYFFFLPPFLAVFLAAVFFFAALRLAAIMLHLL